MAQIEPSAPPTESPTAQSPSQQDDPEASSLSIEPVSHAQRLVRRLSSHSHGNSRQTSTVFPLFHSSLPYALVRDFAYPPYNPMHYGPVRDPNSHLATPDGDYDSTRRVSDPPPWETSVGPWRDSSFDGQGQQLPSTSFGLGGEGEDDGRPLSLRLSKHRKSKSYADMDFARGRRRNSREYERSRQQGNNDGSSQGAPSAHHYVGYFAHAGDGYDDRNDSAHGQQHHPGSASRANHEGYDQDGEDDGNDGAHPPFREDSDTVPYSPSALEEHRPESASLDEAFAGPSLALYDFHPENDNELALREGQVIQVGYRHGQGWLVAANIETGEQGLVPEEYVRLLRDIEGGWPNEAAGVAGDAAQDEKDGHEERREDGGEVRRKSSAAAEKAADPPGSDGGGALLAEGRGP